MVSIEHVRSGEGNAVEEQSQQADVADLARVGYTTVWSNTHIPLVNEMPHGGYKQSGYGKDMGIYSLEEYTQIKHVMASLD